MNPIKNLTLAVLIIASPFAAQSQQNLKSDPAYLNIDGAINLEIAQPEVNVNLPRFLLKNAVSEFDGGDGDPFAKVGVNVSELIKDIKLIRVMVIEANEKSKTHLNQATAKLRSSLEKNWMPIVNIPEENIGIYALSDKSGEEMAGLALLINDGGDVIVGNIVGNLPLGKILKIAASMGGENALDIEAIMAQFAGANPGNDAKPSGSN